MRAASVPVVTFNFIYLKIIQKLTLVFSVINMLVWFSFALQSSSSLVEAKCGVYLLRQFGGRCCRQRSALLFQRLRLPEQSRHGKHSPEGTSLLLKPF